MAAIPSPSPLHVLRTHQQPVSAIFISSDNERIYSGDARGRVVITSTRSLRAIADWAAHTDGLLGVEEFGDLVITHGRDNKIHVWNRPTESVSIRQGGAASLTDLSVPPLRYSLDVNALNYCRFSLLPAGTPESEVTALIAVPNLVESSLVDIWTLPDRTRLHAAIGDPQDTSATSFSDGRSGSKTGIIMSAHLYYASPSLPSTSAAQRELRLLCAYEDGGVVLRRRITAESTQTVGGRGWEVVWKSKLHVEASLNEIVRVAVMAMAVSKDCGFALTVSADHLVARYDLTVSPLQNASSTSTQTETENSGRIFRTKHPGNAAIAIRDDGRICAIGGWDGKVRLYSTKNFKSLGTLVYHKETCQALAFASSFNDRATDWDPDNNASKEAEEGEDDMTNEEKQQRGRWLIVTGKDCRVSIWGLMSFERA
ncbi:WD40-repeat-containing domain protein [Melanogaster broomeanus]|nr:WD40-repeat-containing domain protein [Melanogaster broomeanus]